MSTVSNTGAVAALDAAIALLLVGSTQPTPTIRLYDGTPPARPDVALSGNTLLAENAMSATPFAGAVDDSGNNRATATANAIADDTSANADAVGGATFCRLFNRDDVPIFQIPVGESGTEAIINNADVQDGTTVSYTSLVLALPEGTHP